MKDSSFQVLAFLDAKDKTCSLSSFAPGRNLPRGMFSDGESQESNSVFSPLDGYYEKRMEELDVPPLPMSATNPVAEINKFMQGKKKRNKKMHLFILIIVGGVLAFIYIENEDGKEKTSETVILGCTPENIELSNAQVKRKHYVQGTNLFLYDLSISCFSNSAWAEIESLDLIASVQFLNSSIDVFDQNVFSTNNQFSSAEFHESRIQILKDQQITPTSVSFFSSEIKIFPENFPATLLFLNNLINFEPTQNFISFVAKYQKEVLEFTKIFDDEKVNKFSSLLASGEEVITFHDDYGTLVFRHNILTSLPNNFFSSHRFLFNNLETVLDISHNPNLNSLGAELFTGMSGSLLNIYFDECFKLKHITQSIMKTNLKSISLLQTAVESFEEVDFSGFPNLVSLLTGGAPVTPKCEEEEEFRQKYGINSSVRMSPCV
eukprot:snap_masked-scaffold_8-processed-gene-1.32-mRNA-1 protein AED:1.00 eAED:1.00 QI:0/0/0/0/1/1/2/0/433